MRANMKYHCIGAVSFNGQISITYGMVSVNELTLTLFTAFERYSSLD